MITNQKSLFREKYLKYKKKYLDLKLKQKGGSFNYIFDRLITSNKLNYSENVPRIISMLGENLIYYDRRWTGQYFLRVVNQYGKELNEYKLKQPVINMYVTFDRIYVLFFSSTTFIISSYDYEFKEISSFEIKKGWDDNLLIQPYGMVIFNNQIFISDRDHECIKIFDMEGNFIRRIDFNPPKLILGKLIIMNENILIIVNNSILKCSLDGSIIQIIGNSKGESGSTPGLFNTPSDIKIYDNNHFIVSDLLNNRLQLINFDGTFVSEIKNISEPESICVSNERKDIYVIEDEDGFQSIKKFINIK